MRTQLCVNSLWSVPRVTLMALFCLAALSPESAYALNFVVNSISDDHDANFGDGKCETARGSCTLRAAIEEANGNRSGDVHTISFDLLPGLNAPIVVTKELPPIVGRILLDGTIGETHAGEPRRIRIDGSNIQTSLFGLVTMTAGTTISNIEIYGFPTVQVTLKGSRLLGSRIGRAMPDGRPYPSTEALVVATKGSEIGSADASILPCEGDCNVFGPAINGALAISGSDSLVAGNHIGFDAAAVRALPVGQTAVRVFGPASRRSRIGGAGDENLILAGAGAAVVVERADSITLQHLVSLGPNILRSQEDNSESIPYRLSSTGFVENDVDDSDSGPNSLLNHPAAVELNAGDNCTFDVSGIATPNSQLYVYAASSGDALYPGSTTLLGSFEVDGPDDTMDRSASWAAPDSAGAASRFAFSVPAVCSWPSQRIVLQSHHDGHSSQLSPPVDLLDALPDSDADGVVDVIECACARDVAGDDSDDDGLIDAFDPDANGDGICETPLVATPFGVCDCGDDLDCSGTIEPDELEEPQQQCDVGDPFDPTITEVCDGVDNNCDGMVDAGPDIAEQRDPGRVAGIFAYADSDGDGCGFGSARRVFCEGAGGYALSADDASDEDGVCCGNGALEEDEPCDGYQSNAPGCPAGFTGRPICENQPGNDSGDGTCTYGQPPDGCEAAVVCYADRDGDGFAGTALAFVEGTVCANESDGDDVSLSETFEDCADLPQQACSVVSFPGGEEICDGCDNDCDSSTPDGADEPDGIYFVDADADGCGAGTPLCGKSGLPGYVQNSDDADDSDGQCCGNGIVEGGERCDSDEVVVCSDVGAGSTGTATCTPECVYDTTKCDAAPDECPQDYSKVDGVCRPDECRDGYSHGAYGCEADNCLQGGHNGGGGCNPGECMEGFSSELGRCVEDGSDENSGSGDGCGTVSTGAPPLGVFILLLGGMACVIGCRRRHDDPID